MKEELYNILIKLYPELASFPRTEIPGDLFRLLEAEYQSFNNVKTIKYKRSLADNIYQFAAAKTYKMLSDFRIFDKNLNENILKENINKFIESNLNKINVETNHIEKVSDITNKSIESKYLKYITQEDSKVRNWHSQFNNLILTNDSPMWSKVVKVLGEWNCRCKIVAYNPSKEELSESALKINELKDDERLQQKIKDINKKNGNDVIINIDDNRIFAFNENTLIKDMPTILRKRFNKKYE